VNLTNTYGLPEALVRAIKNDPYTGGGDISVTKLIDAPQVRVLRKQFGSAVVEDVSDRIWSLLGQAVHTILERAGEEDHVQVEERLYAEVDGWKVSGQYDRMDLHGTTLDDYKVTSTYAVKGKVEWERQLNCLRWLAVKNGYTVERLRIVAILKDWKKANTVRDPNYPPVPVAIVEVPVWDLAETYEYIRDRVALHQRAEAGESIECTDEERWFSGTKYALMKKGGKRAIKIYERKDDVEITDGTFVEERPGVYRRCQDYCEVAPFCDQWQRISGQAVSHPTGEVGDGGAGDW
jgi:hypothetical protein